MGVVVSCYLRFAAYNALFVVVFRVFCLAPDSAVSLLLPALIGIGRASEYCFTNTPISAEHALAMGLANRIVPATELAQQSFQLAASLAQGPVGAMGLSKRAFNKAVLNNLEQTLDYEAYLQDIASRGEEHKEGVRAFLEKRPPHFAQL